MSDVASYIAAAPKAAQPRLRELRRVIRSAAPKAEEKISYGIPFYEYGGRLIYFAGYANHVALYPAQDIKGLEQYQAAKATLRFPHDEPLPVAKISKFVKTRVKERDAEKGSQKRAGARPSGSAR